METQATQPRDSETSPEELLLGEVIHPSTGQVYRRYYQPCKGDMCSRLNSPPYWVAGAMNSLEERMPAYMLVSPRKGGGRGWRIRTKIRPITAPREK